MPHPRTARPAPDPEDDCSPEEEAALRAELQRRLDHLRWAFGQPLTDDPEPAPESVDGGPDLT
jgi:hypothetical protein